MDKPSNMYLMIFYLLVPVYGRTEGLFPSCEVGLMVRRGTTLKTAPHQQLTVSCPFKRCGKSVKVSWCKILDTNICERIKNTQDVEIRQRDVSVKNELVSCLTFKRISVQDGGQYRCVLKGYGYVDISHSINVSVSDTYKEDEPTHNAAAQSLTAPGDEAESWLPYFFICASIALVVFTLSAVTLLSFDACNQIRTHKSTKGKELSTRTMPALPKWSAPVNTHSSWTPPSLVTSGNQPLARAGDDSQAPFCATYSTINHSRACTPYQKTSRCV